MYNNNNNAILIRSSRIAQNYQAEFDEMFIDGVFTRRDDTKAVPSRQTRVNNVLVETYFSPEDGQVIEERIVELINGAKSSVKFMVFNMTLDSLGQAAINRMRQGVDVRGVFETTGSLQGQMTVLGCAGAPVRQDGNPDILHHKVIIIDDAIVVFGSFNFSASARDNNSENLLIVHDAEFASAFAREFARRFNEGKTLTRAQMGC
jgi:phosphatidylserine/phosphatidylglycerophosphate/cardiolipin synthase-like enzyme